MIEKVAREEQQLSAYKNQQKEIAALQEFADRFRAKASKASQAQSKLKQIDRMEKIEAPLSQEKTVHMRFPQPPRSGIRAITLKGIDFSYGDLVVYRGLEFEAERGQRIVLVGPNGAGKSTLLKLLAGNLTPSRGTRELGHNVKVGYFSQHRMESLNARHTVLESVQDMPNPPGEQTARTVLGSFLFRGDDVFKPVGVLERWRKVPPRPRQAAARPAESVAHGRADDPPRHRLDRRADQCAPAIRRHAHLHQSRRSLYSTPWPARSCTSAPESSPPYAGDYQYYLEKSKATSAREALTAGEKLTNDQPAISDSRPAPAASGNALRPPRKSKKEQKRAEAEVRQAQSPRPGRNSRTVWPRLKCRSPRSSGSKRNSPPNSKSPRPTKPAAGPSSLNQGVALRHRKSLERLTAEWEALAGQRSEG